MVWNGYICKLWCVMENSNTALLCTRQKYMDLSSFPPYPFSTVHIWTTAITYNYIRKLLTIHCHHRGQCAITCLIHYNPTQFYPITEEYDKIFTPNHQKTPSKQGFAFRSHNQLQHFSSPMMPKSAQHSLYLSVCCQGFVHTITHSWTHSMIHWN